MCFFCVTDPQNTLHVCKMTPAQIKAFQVVEHCIHNLVIKYVHQYHKGLSKFCGILLFIKYFRSFF